MVVLRYLRFFLLIGIFSIFLFTSSVLAQTVDCRTDINGDTRVDLLDYSVFVRNFLRRPLSDARADITEDGVVDLLDYSSFVRNFLRPLPSGCGVNPTATQGPAPTVPPTSNTEWNQFGGNAQKTNGTTQIVSTPWRLKWQWNSSNSSGKKDTNHLLVPDLYQQIVGGGLVYMIGNDTLYALNQTNGAVTWSRGGMGALEGTPAYNGGYLYLVSESGTLYKLQASSGQTVSSVSVGGGVTEAPALYANTLYLTTRTGKMMAFDTSNLSKRWEYTSVSPFVTAPVFSPSKNIVVAVSQDLYVHGVQGTNGSGSWRRKPTVRNYSTANESSDYTVAEPAWPVIAEQHGVVFVRYRLEWNTLWTWNPYPTTNSAIRSNLVAQPDQQVLFAMNLTDGSTAFTPAVGNGGQGDGGDLSIGPPPAISTVNGKEVAYTTWRNGLTCQGTSWCDAREDTTMGEMVLDTTTVSGYQAGDVRFVRFEDIQTDEMVSVTVSGDTVFHGHWLITAAHKITDRSAGRGDTFNNPIQTSESPFVIWRQCNGTNICSFPGCTANTNCGVNCAFNNQTRYCSEGLFSYGDQRRFPAGFYEYHNDIPYHVSGGTYYTIRPYTVVSNGMVMIKTIDGGLMVFENGSPGASLIEESTVAGVSTEQIDESKLPTISYTQALQYLDNTVRVTGTIRSVENNRPKAMYLGFTNPHDGALLIRIFEKDLPKFPYDVGTLQGKKITVTGRVSLYSPEGKDPEIVVTDPSQILVVQN